jgi:ABC-type proline/glycine betaine transport system permease subunit
MGRIMVNINTMPCFSYHFPNILIFCIGLLPDQVIFVACRSPVRTQFKHCVKAGSTFAWKQIHVSCATGRIMVNINTMPCFSYHFPNILISDGKNTIMYFSDSRCIISSLEGYMIVHSFIYYVAQDT